MEQIERIKVNLEIREIAFRCALKIKNQNHALIEELFKSRVNKLFSKELPAFQEAEPNFKDLTEWFWRYVRQHNFMERLGL